MEIGPEMTSAALPPSDSSIGSPPAQSGTSSHNNNIHNHAGLSKFDLLDDDEEGDVCRICRNPGELDNPLRYPCACSGSIKFVHQDCLLQWLNHSNARQCEVS